MRRAPALALAMLVLVLAACTAGGAGQQSGATTDAATSAPPPTRPASAAETCPPAPLPCRDADYRWGLGISNGTTLAVTLRVNGRVVRTFGPHDGTTSTDEIQPTELPRFPWLVEVDSPSGRRLLDMTVVTAPLSLRYPDGHGSVTGAAARVDLSCGRLDLWAGPPLSGPIPGPGTPGDCAP